MTVAQSAKAPPGFTLPASIHNRVETYQAVKACRCTPRTYKPPHDASPDSLKTWNMFSGTEKKEKVPF